MIGFYYGTEVPGENAQEGIYFIDNDNNKYSIYIKRDGEAVIKCGETNEGLSKIGHVHKVTAEGTVSQPTFTGKETTITSTYTPSGTVSQPTFEGEEVETEIAKNKYQVQVLTGVNNTPTFPTVKYGTPPSCTYTEATFTPTVDESGVLSFEFSGGSINFNAGTVTSSGGAFPTYNTDNVAAIEHIHKVTAKGEVSQPTFTGNQGSASGIYTPSGTVSQPTFTGSEIDTKESEN